MEALDRDVIDHTVEDFYYLSRAALVKDEKNLDKFDRVFGHVFKGLELITLEQSKDIPAEWLKRLTDSFLTEEDRHKIFSANARRVYPRLDALLKAKGHWFL